MAEQDYDESDLLLTVLASRCPSLTAKAFCHLLKESGGAQEILRVPEKLVQFDELRRMVITPASRIAAAKAIEEWRSEGITVVPVQSNAYPERLRLIFDPPILLFLKGRIEPDLMSAAIVGSRRADLNGCDIAESFGTEIARSGVPITSGLALGIDAAAHRGALKSALRPPTYAVLGSGLRRIYPPQHERLAYEILDRGGALISQFEPDEKPWPSNFLNRNRIIAGLAAAVVIIQATARSGSLATARYALEEGRDVLVVPGDIRDPRYEGSLKLLKEGAHPATEAADVLAMLGVTEDYGLEEPTDVPAPAPGKKAILDLLGEEGPMTFDQLAARLGRPDSLHADLTLLELEDRVRRRPGNVVEPVSDALTRRNGRTT